MAIAKSTMQRIIRRVLEEDFDRQQAELKARHAIWRAFRENATFRFEGKQLHITLAEPAPEPDEEQR